MSIRSRHRNERGGISGSLIAIISLVILLLGAGSAAIWAYVNYTEQKTNVDTKIQAAVTDAKKAEDDAEEAKFAEREKEPNRQFASPDDYGRLTFDYPKTWSVYVAKDGSTSDGFQAYLNPVTVPPVTPAQQYSLRVTIEQQDYDQVVKSYQLLVQKGDLKSSATSSNGNTGTRLDGSFTKNLRGAAVLYKIRDKTVIVQTDADTFKPDFEKIIKTINFNQ